MHIILHTIRLIAVKAMKQLYICLQMILPSVARSSYPSNIKLYPNPKIKIDYVELEKTTDDIIPDIILHSCGRQLIIEIRVTHKVDNVKLEKNKKSWYICT